MIKIAVGVLVFITSLYASCQYGYDSARPEINKALKYHLDEKKFNDKVVSDILLSVHRIHNSEPEKLNDYVKKFLFIRYRGLPKEGSLEQGHEDYHLAVIASKIEKILVHEPISLCVGQPKESVLDCTEKNFLN